MWPVIADLGVVTVTVWGASLVLAFLVGNFSLWRRLRDDYDGEGLLSLWLILVVAAWIGSLMWACGWFRVCLPPILSLDGALVAAIAALWLWCLKKKWIFWELLDVFAPLTLGIATLGAAGWGASGWLVACVAASGVVLASLVKGLYRDFRWYKSGKSGFVGILALLWWGLVQLVVANFEAPGLYSLGWITAVALAALYIRSGRQVRHDLSNLWPAKRKT